MRFQHTALGLLFGGLLSTIGAPAAAQTAVSVPYIWIHGHTAMIQEPINTAEMYDGVNRIAVALGLDEKRNTKLYRMEAVENIDRGMPIVVQYAPNDDSVATAEGKVTSVDRVHGRIGVKYDDGRSETLRVTQHSTGSGTLEVTDHRVIVYSSNKSGQQVVQYFKRKD
jgi:hypothetical protein